MKNAPLTLILLVLSVNIVFGQVDILDSLRNIYRQSKTSAQKVEVYAQIANEIRNIDLMEGFKAIDTLAQLAQVANSSRFLGQSFALRAEGISDTGNFELAIRWSKKQLALARRIKDIDLEAVALNNIGADYKQLLEHDSAQFYLFKAVTLNERRGALEDLASNYSNLGNIYSELELYDRAINYLQKSLNIRKKLDNQRRIAVTYNNLALAYSGKKDFNNAEKCLQAGINIGLEIEDYHVVGVMTGELAHRHYDAGDYATAIPISEKALGYLRKANREPNTVYPLTNLAAMYNFTQQHQKALEYAQEALRILRKNGMVDPIDLIYKEMANAYNGLGQYREAISWYKKHIDKRDTLYNAESTGKIAELETRFQTEKKEKEIVQQKLLISNQNALLFRQRTWIWGLLLGVIGLLVLGWLSWNRFRLRKRAELDAALILEQKRGLNAVIEAQEAERKRIAKDLHDGIAQEMVALKLGFTALQSKLKQVAPDEAQQIGQLAHQLDDSCTEVRNISHIMLPPTLEQHGLAPSLEMLLRNTLQGTALTYKFENSLVPEHLDEKIEIGVYRITQELLNNIIKHAKAGKILVILYLAGGSLILRIEDDGQGFDFEQARSKGSMGLLNILSRVNTLGGVFQSEAAHPKGTVSIVRIPLKSSENPS